MMKLIQRAYDLVIRPFLPYKISVHNGVPVRTRTKLLDMTDVFPEYEYPLIKGIRQQVECGDKVVIVGGGLGVSTVTAVHATGMKGNVITYEGSHTQYKSVKETIKINGVSDQVELDHAIVGSYTTFSERNWGDSGDVEVLDPVDLPKCDVLELDCEGAEQEILEEMEVCPRIIIVETHGFLDSTTDEVALILENAGYEIIEKETLDQRRGIDVLTAAQVE